jgi:hypothetical protein
LQHSAPLGLIRPPAQILLSRFPAEGRQEGEWQSLEKLSHPSGPVVPEQPRWPQKMEVQAQGFWNTPAAPPKIAPESRLLTFFFSRQILHCCLIGKT